MTEQRPGDENAVSAPIAALANRVRDAWMRLQPVAASVWSESDPDAAEDLSDEGLAVWRETVTALLAEVRNAGNDVMTVPDGIVRDELERFLCEKADQAAARQPYMRSAAAYLHIIALTLLRKAETEPPPVGRIRAIPGWIRHATQRGLFPANERERDFVAAAAATLDRIVQDHGVARVSGEAREYLLEWGANAGTGASAPAVAKSALDEQWRRVEWLLMHGLGTHKPLHWWRDAVEARLDSELHTANLAAARAEAHQTEMSNVDVLQWIEDVYGELRRHIPQRVLRAAAPPATIVAAPPFADLIAAEALYAPAGGGKLFVSSGLRERNGAPRPGPRWYVATVVAHELSPGHHEHLWRGARGRLASCLDGLWNPLGLEGWAVYSEQTVADIKPAAAVACSFQRIRRLLPAALLLAALTDGKHAANAIATDAFRRCPPLAREAQQLTLMRESVLVYAAGLIETENAFTAAMEAAPDRTSVELHEAYLASGPIAPAAAARLALQAVR